MPSGDTTNLVYRKFHRQAGRRLDEAGTRLVAAAARITKMMSSVTTEDTEEDEKRTCPVDRFDQDHNGT
jgi:hypothetical protein